LSEPSSLYNRTRAKARPDDKMRGHVHWMAEQARKQQLPFPQASALPESERRDLAAALTGVGEPGPAFEVLDAMPVNVLVLVASCTGRSAQHNGAVGEGGSPVVDAAPQAPQSLPGGSAGQLCLVREADNSRSVGLALRFDPTVEKLAGTRSLSCRAFLFEPEVVKQFERVLGGAPFL